MTILKRILDSADKDDVFTLDGGFGSLMELYGYNVNV
jgi:hypothetical protein